MKTQLALTAILAVFLLTACATTTLPVRGEFADIPVLAGLSYRVDESMIIESPSVRAARLLYRGRMEPGSLAVEMQKGLEANGWRLVRSTSISALGTTQLYEKQEASLQLRIWEAGLFNYYTYLDIATTRPTSRPATAAIR